jgi:hypothetical protein
MGPPELDRECALLCRQIFGVEPPPGCAEAYRQAHAVVFASVPPEAGLAEAVRGAWDLEALEFAWRLRDKDNALSKKVNILFYVMEARPEGFSAFVNSGPAPLRAWAKLSYETLRSAYKLLKGGILLRRLGAPHG